MNFSRISIFFEKSGIGWTGTSFEIGDSAFELAGLNFSVFEIQISNIALLNLRLGQKSRIFLLISHLISCEFV